MVNRLTVEVANSKSGSWNFKFQISNFKLPSFQISNFKFQISNSQFLCNGTMAR